MATPRAGSDGTTLHDALEKEDALALSRLISDEELKRLKRAEEVLELVHDRKKRTKRTAQVAQAMVGYVALAGFFANAYQNYNSKKDSEARAVQETARWEKEFKRAQEADKYRAFFETSALATDPKNPDKRLVGYALLKEFVDDKSYNSKAIIMLEESLALELRGDSAERGLDDEHRLAVVAILSALSHTSDCKALAQAARTVERLARARPSVANKPAVAGAGAVEQRDEEQLGEVYALYVRQLVGRAAHACQSAKDFREVRRPIEEALVQLPPLGGLTGHPTRGVANRRIAELLRDACAEERQSGEVSDCAEIEQGYLRFCGEKPGVTATPEDVADEAAACAVMKQAVADAAKEPPPVEPVRDGAPADGG